jgi:hypothetical protein
MNVSQSRAGLGGILCAFLLLAGRGVGADLPADAHADVREIAGQSFRRDFPFIGPGRFVSRVDFTAAPKCRFSIEPDGKPPIDLPEPYVDLWACDEVTSVSFVDMNRDGRADITVTARGITGIGPTGVIPFNANTIYYSDGHGGYRRFEDVDAFISRYARFAALRRALARSRFAARGRVP